ncbi:MAG: hypothetical protein HY744_26190 [Deltaproteobacteria bacterium]|nr:hypothetical protein [Deltaproteobacteria bacterium]
MSTSAEPVATLTAESLLGTLAAAKKRRDWEAIARHAAEVPEQLAGAWVQVADEIGFALGQLRRTDEAAALFERVYVVAPSRRIASALAYVYYDALLGRRTRQAERGGQAAAAGRDREADRKAFARWMGEALRLEPRSIKDLYRLGVFEAQVESRHDKPALRAFVAAIESYRALPADERQWRGDLRKPYVRSLYAGARSALRLSDLDRARRLSFDCIREDEQTDHVAPVHKLYLAGKICAALGRSADAERAYRKALAAKGPPERDYVHAALAALALATGRAEDAERWIEANVPPHRRKPVLWRLVGDVKVARGRGREALLAYQNALRKDRAGRHLTLTAMGALELAAGNAQKAAEHFRQANDFRRRKYLSEHLPALDGLATALWALGRDRDAADARAAAEGLREGRAGRGRPGPGGLASGRAVEPASADDAPAEDEAAEQG